MSSNDSLESPKSKVSALFIDPNADITFQSSDGVLFKIYKKHLETASGGFTVPDLVSSYSEEIVKLEESSEVLETLFQFVHPCSESQHHRQPSLLDIEMSIFFAVAEAAEKYMVFGAMNTCIMRMNYVTSQYPCEILNHSVRHDYTDLANKAAVETLSVISLDKFVKCLTHPGALAHWLLYHNKWRELVKTEYEQLPSKVVQPSCKSFIYRRAEFLNQAILHSRSTSNPPSCDFKAAGCNCKAVFDNLLVQIQARLPKFSALQTNLL